MSQTDDGRPVAAMLVLVVACALAGGVFWSGFGFFVGGFVGVLLGIVACCHVDRCNN